MAKVVINSGLFKSRVLRIMSCENFRYNLQEQLTTEKNIHQLHCGVC